MPSDSIAGFLDDAKANRVLVHEQVEQLIRRPDVPQSDLPALCAYLEAQGVLTRFQADAIREGRGHELTFGNYPVIDRLGPCPGGAAYRALHPSLRTPLELRMLRADAYAPTDSPTEVVNRARAFGALPHPNLLPVLDAGVHQGQPYAVVDHPADAAPLDALLQEVGGAMPAFLAAEYGWALAGALRTVHERGGWHGEVRPAHLLVGPLTTKVTADGAAKRRPAPNASVKLAETGLIPVRGPAGANPPDADVLAHLPPERLDTGTPDARGDLYGLGASLYLMLAGRPPFTANTVEELAHKVRASDPPPLAPLRPDAPAELLALVMRMLAKRPDARPQTAAEVAAGLAPFCRPGTLPSASPTPVPMALPVSGVAVHPVPRPMPMAVPVEAEPEPDAWGVNPNAFAEARDASAADTRPTRRRGLTDADKRRSRMWIAVGLCLHLTAMLLLAAWLTGLLDFSSDSEPTAPTRSDKPKPTPQPAPPKQPRTKS